MAGNTFGTLFKLTTFGESHGQALGGIIDGCPAGLELDQDEIQRDLDRRRPGQSPITTRRKERDKVHFLSGLFCGKTTGAPIGFAIYNEDQKPADYAHIAETYRPSHADFVYDKKYGWRDYRGGGRSSARETVSRVVGGAVAKRLLKGVAFQSYVSVVGPISLGGDYKKYAPQEIESNALRCPDSECAREMLAYIEEVRKQGDTVGGVVTGIVENVPVGLGEPVFDKLHAELGKAMLSINAAKGFECGSGFAGSQMRGSAHNDVFNPDGSTQTNFSGGVQGGISNGMDIGFRVAFKPVATLMRAQRSIDRRGEPVELIGKGRHDPCVLPRAVPIVEAMAALVIADFYLRAQTSKLRRL